MSERGKVDINIKKYEFAVWSSDNLILYLLKKQAEETIHIDRELAQKFIESDESFYSWLCNLFSSANEEGVVIEAIVSLDGLTVSAKLFKEPELDTKYAFLPIPYIAKLNKMFVIKEALKNEDLIKENSYSYVYEFSNEEYYVFFNPIKVLKEFYAMVLVTNKGLEFIPLLEITKPIEIVSMQKKKGVKKTRKKKRKKRRSKKSKQRR